MVIAMRRPRNGRRSRRRWRIVAALAAAMARPGSAPLSAAEAAPASEQRPDNEIADGPAPESAQPGSTWNDSRQFVVLGGVLDHGTMPGDPATGIEAAAAQSWSATHS